MSIQATVTENGATERRLAVEIPQEMLAESVKQKTAEYRKRAKLPGFREGHVPEKVIVSRFGEAIRHEALEGLIDKTLSEELKKSELRPVDRGSIDDFQDDRKGPIAFTYTFEVDPEIEVTDYADLGVVPDPVAAEESEVEEELAVFRRQMAEEAVVDRPAADEDVVKGDYLRIEIGGEEQPLAENPVFRLTLGTTKLKGLEAGLVGATAGEEKTVNFTFPSDYPNDEIAGKEAVYQVSVKEIVEMVQPELDDSLGQKAGAESLEALRNDIRSQIESFKRRQANQEAHTRVIDALLQKNTFAVPEARIRYFVSQDLKKEEVTDEEVAAGREKAILEIRRYRILDYIANQEKIKATQSEVDAHVAMMAASYGVPADAFKNHLRSSGRMAEVREDLRIGKTLDWLIGIRPSDEKKV